MPNNSYYQPYGTYIGANYPQPQAAAPMQSQQMPMQQNSAGYVCRPVTCREEAVASQVDYFSAGLIMPDLPHGLIYVKRFNPNTGASEFAEFKYSPPAPVPESGSIDTSQFITRKEFEEFTRRMQAVKEAEYDPV